MGNPRIRGVRSGDERETHFRRDTRRLGEIFHDALGDPLTTAVTLGIAATMIVAFPLLAHVAPLIVGTIVWIHVGHLSHRHLPLRLPISAKCEDPNTPAPGRKTLLSANGLIYVGNAWESGQQEIWMSRNDATTHAMMLATTGAGKTVALVGEAANYIGIGGGLIYADAKASPALAFDLTAVARRMGREDDLAIINYMTGNRVVSGSGAGDRLTNTANPLASGSADSLVQIMSSLIPSPEGDNAVFGERALTMMTSVLYGLVDLRDGGHIDLGVSTLRDYLPIERIEVLANDPRLRTETAKNSLGAYLRSLPNYKTMAERVAKDPRTQRPKLDANGKPEYEAISEEAGRQHGFAQMYFTRALSSLTDTYGHIFYGALGEVDYGDVVRNRRILVIMLPALEKSLSELQNLGKINLSGIRDAISSGLGSKLEGSKAEVVDTLTAGAKIPSKIILDEYGYISTEGFAIVAAQARSLLGGFSVLWASQTWAGIKRGSEREADEIWGNSNFKYFGRLIDNESFQRLQQTVGEARTTETGGFAIKPESMLGGYSDTLQANIEKTSRVDFTDMQGQTEGEFHVTFGGNMIRARTFYAGLDGAPFLRINRYLRVGEKLAQSAPAPESSTTVASGDSGGGINRSPTTQNTAAQSADNSAAIAEVNRRIEASREARAQDRDRPATTPPVFDVQSGQPVPQQQHSNAPPQRRHSPASAQQLLDDALQMEEGRQDGTNERARRAGATRDADPWSASADEDKRQPRDVLDDIPGDISLVDLIDLDSDNDRLAAESKQMIGIIDAAVGAYPTAQTHQVLGDLTLERVTESVEQALRDFIAGAAPLSDDEMNDFGM